MANLGKAAAKTHLNQPNLYPRKIGGYIPRKTMLIKNVEGIGARVYSLIVY